MSIIFQSGGILTTVQDSGRQNFRRFGINPNGTMDRLAARLINILLGNNETESVLEMHFPAARILFTEDAAIAFGGADFGAQLDGEKIENWRPAFVEKGQILSFPQKNFGNRCYLAVKGGFEIENWLGSASTNLKAEIGGFGGRQLKKGDEIFLRKKTIVKPRTTVKISKHLLPFYSSLPTVRVLKGAEFEYLNDTSKKNFRSEKF